MTGRQKKRAWIFTGAVCTMLGMGAFIGQVYAQSLEEPVLTTSEEALPNVLEAEETNTVYNIERIRYERICDRIYRR